MARGKRYREAYDRIDRSRAYEPAEAVSLIKAGGGAKFDETVELHLRLGVNVRHAEEQLRADWDYDVPVIIVDGKVHARYRVDAEQLRTALRRRPWWRRLTGRA